MNINKFRNLMNILVKEYKNRSEYLDTLRKVDDRLQVWMFDNEYTESHYRTIEILMKYTFDETIYDWISWYLYEDVWASVDGREIKVDKTTYKIKDVDSFVEFIKNEYFMGDENG